MSSAVLISLAGTLLLAGIHLAGQRLHFLDVIPRSRLLSVAGGISVAYVFLRILPELNRAQTRVGYSVGEALRVPRSSIYVVALIGLSVFYGLERLAARSRKEQRLSTGADRASAGVFWIHIGSYSIVNLLVGYLLLDRMRFDPQRGILFSVAMALYFVVNDYGLMVQHRSHYRAAGRWVLALALLVGWSASLAWQVPDVVLSVALAFVGGGVIFNVMKEEMPEERESRFWAFALGVGAYAALLLIAG